MNDLRRQVSIFLAEAGIILLAITLLNVPELLIFGVFAPQYQFTLILGCILILISGINTIILELNNN